MQAGGAHAKLCPSDSKHKKQGGQMRHSSVAAEFPGTIEGPGTVQRSSSEILEHRYMQGMLRRYKSSPVSIRPSHISRLAENMLPTERAVGPPWHLSAPSLGNEDESENLRYLTPIKSNVTGTLEKVGMCPLNLEK